MLEGSNPQITDAFTDSLQLLWAKVHAIHRKYRSFKSITPHESIQVTNNLYALYNDIRLKKLQRNDSDGRLAILQDHLVKVREIFLEKIQYCSPHQSLP